MKLCKACDVIKPTSEFNIKRYKIGTIGLRFYCKSCSKAQRDEWRKSSPRDNERNKQYNKDNAEEIRGKKLVKNYWPNFTWQEAITEWDRLFKEQDGKCALGHLVSKLHVDHCHHTGVVRGLLCYNCNNGIGRLKDNIQLLEKAIDYIKRSKIKAA